MQVIVIYWEFWWTSCAALCCSLKLVLEIWTLNRDFPCALVTTIQTRVTCWYLHWHVALRGIYNSANKYQELPCTLAICPTVFLKNTDRCYVLLFTVAKFSALFLQQWEQVLEVELFKPSTVFIYRRPCVILRSAFHVPLCNDRLLTYSFFLCRKIKSV